MYRLVSNMLGSNIQIYEVSSDELLSRLCVLLRKVVQFCGSRVWLVMCTSNLSDFRPENVTPAQCITLGSLQSMSTVTARSEPTYSSQLPCLQCWTVQSQGKFSISRPHFDHSFIAVKILSQGARHSHFWKSLPYTTVLAGVLWSEWRPLSLLAPPL